MGLLSKALGAIIAYKAVRKVGEHVRDSGKRAHERGRETPRVWRKAWERHEDKR